MDERINLIRELLANEDFGNEVQDIDTAEGFQAAFKRHGVDLSLPEVESVLAQVYVANGGELSEEQLEQASGGYITIAGALIIAGGMAFSYGVGYAIGKYWKKRGGACI